jgi:hypothetical protein
MPCSSHSRFYHPHNSGWGVQIIKLLVIKFSPPPCYLVLLRSKYSPPQAFRYSNTWQSPLLHDYVLN